jgi:hypothetical protein
VGHVGFVNTLLLIGAELSIRQQTELALFILLTMQQG